MDSWKNGLEVERGQTSKMIDLVALALVHILKGIAWMPSGLPAFRNAHEHGLNHCDGPVGGLAARSRGPSKAFDGLSFPPSRMQPPSHFPLFPVQSLRQPARLAPSQGPENRIRGLDHAASGLAKPCHTHACSEGAFLLAKAGRSRSPFHFFFVFAVALPRTLLSPNFADAMEKLDIESKNPSPAAEPVKEKHAFEDQTRIRV